MSRFLAEWENRVELWPTEFPGHGVELGRAAAEKGFSMIAAAGGDGTAHDVANGILSAPQSDTTFAIVPIGSANDYAYSFRRQFGTSRLDDDARYPVDVGHLSGSQGKDRYFIEAAGFGLNGHVTLESRKIKSLQGPLLYGLAAWRAIREYRVHELEVIRDEEPLERYPIMVLSVMLGLREGSFIMAPSASLDDGLFDVVLARPVGSLEVAAMLPRLYFRGPPTNHPQIRMDRCQRLRIRSQSPLTIHTDGEMFSTAADAIYEIDVQLLPRRLHVKLCLP